MLGAISNMLTGIKNLERQHSKHREIGHNKGGISAISPFLLDLETPRICASPTYALKSIVHALAHVSHPMPAYHFIQLLFRGCLASFVSHAVMNSVQSFPKVLAGMAVSSKVAGAAGIAKEAAGPLTFASDFGFPRELITPSWSLVAME